MYSLMRIFLLLLALYISLPTANTQSGIALDDIIANLIGSAPIQNICDEENNWWQMTVGGFPQSNGVRTGKHDTVQRNVTWFSVATTVVQLGVATSALQKERRRGRDYLMPSIFLHPMFKGFCRVGAVPQYMQSPALRCTVIDGVAQCPEKDDWSRLFFWMNWSARPYLNRAPFSFEVKTKSFGNQYRTIFTLTAGEDEIEIADVTVEQNGNDLLETLKVPILAMTVSNNYKEDIHPNKIVTTTESSTLNNAGKKVLHVVETQVNYKEEPTSFYNFSFGVPSQDNVRKQAIQYKFHFKDDAPKVQKKSLYSIDVYARDLTFHGNETYNVWHTGEVERWKFVNLSSPLMSSDGTVDQVYIYKDDFSGYEVAKIKLPFAHISVSREWANHSTDVKKVFFQFKPDSIVPSMELIYTASETQESFCFTLPSADFGTSVNVSYEIDNDGVLLLSVRKADLWSGYKNSVDIFTAYVQRGSSHLQIVIKKNDLFASHYTQFLHYMHSLNHNFHSKYWEHVYTRLTEEIGTAELEHFLLMVQEIPAMQMFYLTMRETYMLFHPEGWLQLVHDIRKTLQYYAKVEETEEEFIIHYDLQNLPMSYLLNYIEPLLKVMV